MAKSSRAVAISVFSDEQERKALEAQLNWATATMESAAQGKKVLAQDIDKASTILKYFDQQKHGSIARPEDDKRTQIIINMRDVEGRDVVVPPIAMEDGVITDKRFLGLRKTYKQALTEEEREERRLRARKANNASHQAKWRKRQEQEKIDAAERERKRLADLDYLMNTPDLDAKVKDDVLHGR